MQSFSFNLSLPCVRESSTHKASSPQDIWALLSDTASLAQEAITAVTINAKNMVIDRHLVTLGLVSSSLVHPREIFRHAIMDGASAVIVSHNHPSGDCTPSAEDVRMTRQLVEAGLVLDIPVLDHVIIGRGDPSFFSLRESGIVSFERGQ